MDIKEKRDGKLTGESRGGAQDEGRGCRIAGMQDGRITAVRVWPALGSLLPFRFP